MGVFPLLAPLLFATRHVSWHGTIQEVESFLAHLSFFKMASGKVSIGMAVEALGVKVVEKEVLMAAFGNLWNGIVLRSEVRTKGSGRKWKVGWNLEHFSVVREHGSRTLTVVQAAAAGGRNSHGFSMRK